MSSTLESAVQPAHAEHNAPARRSSIFSQLPHPCVLSLPAQRQEILANAQDPLWQQFIREVAAHYDSGADVPAPKFPVFCHDGDLDAIMAASVLAYVTQERRYFNSLAAWLRAAIAYFNDNQLAWESHLNQLTAGRPTAEIDPRQQGNPRQFFEGFGLPGLYWVEGGLALCILHLYDLIEAYAPELLTESEKLQLENALTHFATRFAFHEEAFKYNNRAAFANVALLIAGLTHQDPRAAKLLLNRARERNREVRPTFSDDGSYLEGSHAYHYLAADALALFALLHNHAFPDDNLFEGFAGDAAHDAYPSIEKMMEAHARVAIPGEPPREHPRGVGAHASHLPLLVRASMVLAYRQHQNPHIGWLIAGSRAVVKPPSPSPMRLTNHTILSLGNYVPLETFWLERLPYRTQLPEPGLTILSDFGGLYSRSGGVDSGNSFAWAHYGFHGTGKGQRDCCHIGLSVGGHELLADPFPREGPPCRDSSFCHNTITADHAEIPITIGNLLAHESLPNVDIATFTNVGGTAPQRQYLFDPREESTYVFNIEPTARPPYILQRTLIHWHRNALIAIDDVSLTDSNSGPLDWFFYTNAKPQDYDPQAAARAEDYLFRSPVKQSPAKLFALATRGRSTSVEPHSTHAILYPSHPHTLRLLAAPLTASITCEFGHLQHPAYRSADGREVPGLFAYFTRFRTTSRHARIAWIWTWGQHTPILTSANPFDSQGLQFSLAAQTLRVIHNTTAPQIRASVT